MKIPAVLVPVLIVLAGCSNKPVEQAAPTPSASAVRAVSAAPSASSQAAAPSGGGDDEVRPVYPVTSDPPDPLAMRLCEALHGVPTKRRGECCAHSPGLSLAPECARTLSAAMRDKAVSVEPAAVDACVSAMEKAHEGCGWVGPAGAPLPAVCDGIVRGAIADGKRCRSSLECTDGLRCVGVGPTDAGVCRKPLASDLPCAVSVDTLAALSRQEGFEARHPECAGFCAQRTCRDFVAVGGECKTAIECGSGKICLKGKCAEGELPAEGKPCLAGACARGLRCEKSSCVGPKEEGAACKNDGECRGGCLRGDGGKGGTCGMKCRML